MINLTQEKLPKTWEASNESELGSYNIDPTSFIPAIAIPKQPTDNWEQRVAVGMMCAIRDLRGNPRLIVPDGTDVDNTIANDINNEIERLAVQRDLHTRGLQYPTKTANPLTAAHAFVANYTNDILPALAVFRIMQFALREKDGVVGSGEAVTYLSEHFPDKAELGKSIADRIHEAKLTDPLGKAVAVNLTLQSLGFNKDRFALSTIDLYNRSFEFDRIDEYIKLSPYRKQLELLNITPRTTLQFTLPFSIPVADGIYRINDAILMIMSEQIENIRSSFPTRENVTINPHVDQSGLYSLSNITLTLPTISDVTLNQPPLGETYEIYRSYPSALREVVEILNLFNDWAREQTKRFGIPDVTLPQINKLAVKIFDQRGEKILDIPFQSTEFIHVTETSSEPAPTTDIPIQETSPLPLYRSLLSQAKLHLIESNVRRAAIDFYTAFEAFVADHITPFAGDVSETTKTRFLRMYGSKLDDKTRSRIEALRDTETRRISSMHRVLHLYSESGTQPPLDQALLNKVKAIVTGTPKPDPPGTLE